jgi:NADH-quinone oxidoreductase subunit G
MPKLTIDGRETEVRNGATVMDAANGLGIYIPHFCYHKKLSIAANCRMCLVQIEKAPKPQPACATPVGEGMKVFTRSDYARDAQNGVMEFLLINHPLDCPICDQGGECQLQDLAVGYGKSASRYTEEKRVVLNKSLGPLISTDMTRCIHCTRCVRFGQEVGGVMELGMIGRGEHAEIIAFVGKTVDSELSGNVIDLCPVGALTSKPFRYTARNWELSRRRSVSPHDSLGSNLIVEVKHNRVMRVLPLENEELNECWLSDRDRYSYEGLNSEERLLKPPGFPGSG